MGPACIVNRGRKIVFQKTQWAVVFTTLLLCISPCKADICGETATLVEIEKFYISQHDSQEVEIDLSNYFKFFADLESHLNPFKNIFENYTTDRKLNELEPFPVVPYDDDRNIVMIPETIGELRNAPRACALRGDELIFASTESTQKKIGGILRQLGLKYAPINVRTFQGSIYDPNYHHITNISEAKIQAIQNGQLPVITHEGGLLIPDGSVTTTTAASVSTTAASTPLASVLCFRKNNPWDRTENRPSWFLKAAEIAQNSLKFLEKASSTFSTVKNVLQNLDKNSANIGKKIKMITPHFMNDIIRFLRKFSEPRKWEQTVPADESLFYNFIQNAKQLNHDFNLKDDTLLKMRQNKMQFNVPQVVERHWNEQLNYDHSNQGILTPVKLTLSKGVKDSTTPRFYANVSVDVFNRNDLITIYSIMPNIVNGQIITAQYVVSSPRTQFTTAMLPTKLNCLKRTFEEYPVCTSFAVPPLNSNSESDSIDCARGLLKKDLSKHAEKCPKTTAPDSPIAYRVRCDNSHFRSAIISSTVPIKISITCDNTETVFEDLSTFPVRINTDCEIQQVSSSGRRILLTQLHKDSVSKNNFEKFDIVTPPPELQPEGMLTTIYPYLLPITMIIGTAIFLTLVVMMIIAILEPEKFCCSKCCRKGQPSEPQIAQTSMRSIFDEENERSSLIFRPGPMVSTSRNTPRNLSRASSRRSLSENRLPTLRLQV